MKKTISYTLAAIMLSGFLCAGAETDPAWWPWANLAGGVAMLGAALILRLLHPPGSEAVISGLLPRRGGREK